MPADSNQRYLLIGTGTGVTPYRAMLPQLETQIRQRGVKVVLLFGARTPVELLYGDEFRAFADKHPDNFRFVPCLSRELPAADSSQAHADVRHGYVQQFLEEFAPDAGARHRLPVRQPEHGRCLLRVAEGLWLAGAADPPREVRQQQVDGDLAACARTAASGRQFAVVGRCGTALDAASRVASRWTPSRVPHVTFCIPLASVILSGDSAVTCAHDKGPMRLRTRILPAALAAAVLLTACQPAPRLPRPATPPPACSAASRSSHACSAANRACRRWKRNAAASRSPRIRRSPRAARSRSTSPGCPPTTRAAARPTRCSSSPAVRGRRPPTSPARSTWRCAKCASSATSCWSTSAAPASPIRSTAATRRASGSSSTKPRSSAKPSCSPTSGQCLQSLEGRADPRFYTTGEAIPTSTRCAPALGVDKVNVIGGSYGTRVAQQYAMHYPQHTRSVVLDGVAPNRLVVGGEFAQRLQEALRQAGRAMREDAGVQGALRQCRGSDLIARLQALKQRLKATPVEVSYHDPASNEVKQRDADRRHADRPGARRVLRAAAEFAAAAGGERSRAGPLRVADGDRQGVERPGRRPAEPRHAVVGDLRRGRAALPARSDRRQNRARSRHGAHVLRRMRAVAARHGGGRLRRTVQVRRCRRCCCRANSIR